MRTDFTTTVERIGRGDDKVVFLFVDLYYNTLESVVSISEFRFITVGIADQNMIELTEGMAYKGDNICSYSRDQKYHPQPSGLNPISIVRQLQSLMN